MTSKLKKKERKLAKQAARALATPGKQPKSMEAEDSPDSVIPEANSPPQQIVVAATAAAKEKAAAVAARGAMPANRKEVELAALPTLGSMLPGGSTAKEAVNIQMVPPAGMPMSPSGSSGGAGFGGAGGGGGASR